MLYMPTNLSKKEILKQLDIMPVNNGTEIIKSEGIELSWSHDIPVTMMVSPVISPHCCLGPGLDIWPGPHVLMLLLHPAQLSIAILLRHLKFSRSNSHIIIVQSCQDEPAALLHLGIVNYDASWVISATVTVWQYCKCNNANLSSKQLYFSNISKWSDLLHDVEGEGADLLEGVDGDLVLQAPVAPLLQKVIVDFASADENLRKVNIQSITTVNLSSLARGVMIMMNW